MCRGEELVVGCGVVGVKEGVRRVLGMGEREGVRLPLKGGIEGESWERFEGVMGELQRIEES